MSYNIKEVHWLYFYNSGGKKHEEQVIVYTRNMNLELSLISVTFTNYRYPLITDGITCRVKIS